MGDRNTFEVISVTARLLVGHWTLPPVWSRAASRLLLPAQARFRMAALLRIHDHVLVIIRALPFNRHVETCLNSP